MGLDEARRVLEGSQAPRRAHAAGTAKAPDGRDRSRRTDDTADREGPKPAPPPALPVHATILRMRLVSLGDLILDVVVGLAGPLVPGDDCAATTRVGAGGQ